MSCDRTKTARIPLSEHTIRELRSKAAEFRTLAASARTAADAQALHALGARFDALADQRYIVPAEATRLDVQRPAQHVLLVDDLADVLVSVGAFLLNAGYTVRKAANGDDALQLIAADPRIEVLVTDFAMPGLNGAGLIAQATEIRRNLKALVITGYPNADGLAQLPPHTMVLTKPFRRNTLIAGVRSLLAEPPMPHALVEHCKL